MSQGQRVTIRAIQDEVCRHFRIGRKDMLSTSRMPHLVHPRHIAMYLSRKVAGRSWKQIGHAFDHGHTTAIYAVRKIEAQIDAGSSSTRDSLAAIQSAIGSAANV